MKLAIIAPPNQLQWCDRSTGYQLVLARLLLKDDSYARYYAERGARGDYLIMDNGAAEEGTLTSEELQRAAKKLGWPKQPVEFVLPDKVNDVDKTLELARYYASTFPRSFMAVPQGTTLATWMLCLHALLRIAQPNAIGVSKYCPVPRTQLLNALQSELQLHSQVYQVHCLGVYQDPYEIYQIATQFPWVRGLDTAAPVAFGLKERYVEGYGQSGHIALDWDLPPADKVQAGFIDENIETCLAWASGEDPFEDEEEYEDDDVD